MVKVLVNNLSKEKIKIRSIKEIVRRVLREERVNGVEVSVVLGDDGFIRDLNRKWRGVDSPTDVLSFPFGKKQKGMKNGDCLGEIVISIDTARSQAEYLGHSLEEELKILLIHGVLHLLDYDHERRKDASKMQQRERYFLEQDE